jgi:alginate biosynthesis protein AlgX
MRPLLPVAAPIAIALLLLGLAPPATATTRAPEAKVTVCPAAQAPNPAGVSEPLVSGKAGWLFRQASDLSDDWGLTPDALAGFARFTRELGKRGTSLAVVLVPPRGLLAGDEVDLTEPLAAGFDVGKARASYHELVATLRTAGMAVPDVVDAADAAKLGAGFFFARDHHWRPEGARVTAKATAAAVAKLPSPPTFTPIAFVNDPKPDMVMVGSLGHRVETTCGVPAFAPERYSAFESRPLQPPDPAAALLGDAPSPEIVVAGASNVNKGGADHFNVTGWLREAFGTDVLNVGVDGGGYDTAVLSYFDTDDARAHPPKLLVWEIGVHLPKDLPDHFRQSIPSLYGDCATPEAEGTALVGATDTPVLTLPPGTVSAGHYVVLHATDPAFVHFNASFHTRDPRPDVFYVRRSSRVPNSGRFYLEADSRPGAELVSVSLTTDGTPTPVTARLCRYPDAAPAPASPVPANTTGGKHP